MKSFDFVAAQSVDEAVELLSRHGYEAHLIAGGTALVLMMKQELVQPSMLIGIRDISELRGIRRLADGSLHIGALSTHWEVARSSTAADLSGALAEAFGQIATVRIRNQATVGGNLAHADPAQDPPPVLLALGAQVEAVGPAGGRVIPIEEFFTDYFETVLSHDEVVVGVRVPQPPPRSRATYLKFLPRSADDYATVGVAAWLTLADDGICADLRIGLGAAGPTPMRARRVEAALKGNRLTEQVTDEAAELVVDEVDPIGDIRGSADYKRQMARVWVARALRTLINDGESVAH